MNSGGLTGALDEIAVADVVLRASVFPEMADVTGVFPNETAVDIQPNLLIATDGSQMHPLIFRQNSQGEDAGFDLPFFTGDLKAQVVWVIPVAPDEHDGKIEKPRARSERFPAHLAFDCHRIKISEKTGEQAHIAPIAIERKNMIG